MLDSYILQLGDIQKNVFFESLHVTGFSNFSALDSLKRIGKLYSDFKLLQ